MHRSVILGLLFSLLAGAANAACPGNPTTCGNPMQAQTSGSVMYAAAYGVKADGTISDDVAMKAAVDACAAKGGKLLLPPGQIKLTGAATITLSNCHIEGVGVPRPGYGAGSNKGTMFLLTSASVKPFLCQSNWALSGMSFYWPVQDGTMSYPALISDDGTSQCGSVRINHINIVNAYKAIEQTSTLGWGDWHFTDVQMFAANDLITLRSTGDSIVFDDSVVIPGAWLAMGGDPTAVANAARTQTMFHIKAGGSVNLSLNSFGGIGARYAFYVDNGAIMSESNIDAGWDTVGTIVDTSAGGVWSTGIRISGASATCSMIGATWSSPQTGNFPCFNMGPNGELALTNFQNQGSKGSFIVTSGSSITLQNSGNRGLGGALDGGDYHQIQVTGGSSGMLVQNSYFSGNANTTNNQQHHVHGIVTTGHTPNYLVLQGNTFVYHEDDITTSFASSVTSISGNTTISTAGASSFSIVGAGFGIGMNTWDRLPQATILSGFGTGPAIQTNTGDYRNFRLVIGTGGTSGNGSVKMPVESPGGYMCLATVNDINSFYTASVASNSTDVAFFNYNRSTGGGAPWNAGNVVTVQCQGL